MTVRSQERLEPVTLDVSCSTLIAYVCAVYRCCLWYAEVVVGSKLFPDCILYETPQLI